MRGGQGGGGVLLQNTKLLIGFHVAIRGSHCIDDLKKIYILIGLFSKDQ